jgi:hypothetical protein
VRQLASIVGMWILLANLACAALCSVPQPAPPPCHSQQADGKICDQPAWTDDAAKLAMPLAELSLLTAAPLARTNVVRAVRQMPRRALPPPLILRV